MSDEIDPLRVHVVNVPAIPDRMGTVDRTTVFRTQKTQANQTVTQGLLLIPASKKRRRAVITFVGQSSDIAYLCGSQSDAQNLLGQIIMGLQVVVLTGADDVWVGVPANVGTLSFGLAIEFEGC